MGRTRSAWLRRVALALLTGVIASVLALVARPESALAAPAPPPVVIDGPVQGDAAIRELGTLLPSVAAEHGMTSSELRTELRRDDTLWVDETAQLFYEERPLTGPFPAASMGTAIVASDDTFELHSRPGSSQVIYLDFDGHVVTGTAWNAFAGVSSTFTLARYGAAGSSSFSAGDRTLIRQVWSHVAEDFAPFDVDVTTEDPGTAAIARDSAGDLAYGTRVVIAGMGTTTYSALCSSGCGGKAYVNVFDAVGATHDYYQPALVFQTGVGGLGAQAKSIAEAASHEAGHNLGLQHDGATGTEYYAGHGAWAPIMGNGYSKPITQWSRGEYTGANNSEDDITVMLGNGVSLAADDHPTGAAATVLPGTDGSTADGVIESSSDIDEFSVTVSAGTWTFTAAPRLFHANLDIALELYSSGGSLLASANPVSAAFGTNGWSGMDASVTQALTTGTYTLRVAPTGEGSALSTGYSTYGSLGRYVVGVTSGAGPATPDLLTSGVIPPSAATPGGSATVGATTTNQGTYSSAASDVTFTLSVDAERSVDDVDLSPMLQAGALVPGGSFTGTVDVTVPSSVGAGSYYLLACADRALFVAEIDDSNNCASSVTTVNVMPGVDLDVLGISADAAVARGASTSVLNTVKNVGTSLAGPSTVRFWLSADDSVGDGDLSLAASRSITSLAAGASSSATTSVLIPALATLGSQQLIACADADSTVAEVDETNNCMSTTIVVQESVASGADLRITAFGSPSATAVAGGTLAVSGTVRNGGTSSAGASTLLMFLSYDAVSDVSDVTLGTRAVGSIAAGGAVGSSGNVTVPLATTPGTYYVVGCADATEVVVELSESNNCLASTSQVTVAAPFVDLTVSALANPPLTAITGATIRPSTTVRNLGNSTSSSTSVSYWLSADGIPDELDALLTGTRPVSALAAGASSAAAPTLTIPATTDPGTYLLLACVDDAEVITESDDDNNCRASTSSITVADPVVDLTVSSLANPPLTSLTGGALRPSTTVRNLGTGPAPASTVSYALSEDAVASEGDVLLTGSRTTPILAAGASSSATPTVTIPVATEPGTYYLIACVDPFGGSITESDEINNCKASAATTTVSIPATDLVVSALANPPAAAVIGATLRPSTSVRNAGTLVAAASSVSYWLSEDVATSEADWLLEGSRTTPILAAGATSAATPTLTIAADTEPGTYHLLACVDPADTVIESDDDNNCRASTSTVTVTTPFVDLTVSALANPPATSLTGGALRPSTTVRNLGTGSAPASTVSYALSEDAVASEGDVLLSGSRTTPILAAGTSSSATPVVTIPEETPPGTYYLIACVDPFGGSIPEADEVNNCTASATTTAVSIPIPDLALTALANPPATALTGGTLRPSTTVRNLGTGASVPSAVLFGLVAVETADVEMLTGTRPVVALAPGASSSVTPTLTIPEETPPGTYFLAGCVDSFSEIDESDETNNCRISTTTVVVTIPYVDLAVSVLANPPATSLTGGPLRPATTVRNLGTGVAPASSVTYVLSPDTELSDMDEPLTGSRTTPVLAGGASSAATPALTIPHHIEPGTYYIIACVDPSEAVSESDDDNNCTASASTTVVSNPIPDLVVSALANPPATVVAGAMLRPSTTVRNLGTGAASGITVTYELEAVDTGNATLDGQRVVASLAPGASSAGTPTLQVDPASDPGAYYLVACADSLGVNEESDEDNNCRTSITTVTVVAPFVDLQVTALTNPATARLAGTAMAVTSTVRNLGNVASGASAAGAALSTDAVFGEDDIAMLPTRSVPALAVGASSAGTVSTTIPSWTPTGAYYLIVCADIYSAREESNEDNNCRASTTTVQVTAAEVAIAPLHRV